MLRFAQHLASHRERPFAEFTLERSEGLRVTKLYRCWLLKIIIGLYTLPHASLPTSISNTHQTGCAYDFCAELLFVDERSDVHSSYSSDRACPYHVHPSHLYHVHLMASLISHHRPSYRSDRACTYHVHLSHPYHVHP